MDIETLVDAAYRYYKTKTITICNIYRYEINNNMQYTIIENNAKKCGFFLSVFLPFCILVFFSGPAYSFNEGEADVTAVPGINNVIF